MRLTSLVLLSLLATACGPGEPGPAGPPGPQGPVGAQGPAGTPGATLSASYLCTGTANNGTANFGLVHMVYVMSDESVMATCNLVESTLWTTGINMWRKDQEGAAEGGCIVYADIDDTKNAGYWTMETNAQRTSSSATYRNTGSPLNGRVFSLSCTTN